MSSKMTGTWFARMREKWFKWKLNREIFDQIFPHLQHERNHGYPFQSDAEMQRLTTDLDLQGAFEQLESQIQRMPAGYGASFRHVKRVAISKLVHN